MGVIHYAVNHSKKQAYVLGKNIYFDEDNIPQTVPAMVDHIRNVLDSPSMPTEYIQNIAKALLAMGIDEEFGDSGEGKEFYCDYVIIGSRYDNDKDVGTKLGRIAAECDCIPTEWLETGNPDTVIKDGKGYYKGRVKI